MRSQAAVQNGSHRVPDLVHRGLMPGVEQHDDGGDQLVLGHRLAALRGGNHGADEIVLGRTPALGDQAAHVGGKFGSRLVGRLLVGQGAPEHVHAHVVVRPAQQLRPHGLGHAKQARDDGDRNDVRKGRQQFHLALGGKAVDELVRQRCDFGPKALNLARHKSAVDQGAQACVLGRLQGQQGPLLAVVKVAQMCLGRRQTQLLAGGHMQYLPAKAFVAQQAVDLLVATAKPLCLLLPIKQRALGMQRGVGGVGVAIKSRVARIQVHAALGGVDMHVGRGAVGGEHERKA